MNLEVIDAVIFIAGAAAGLLIGINLKKDNKTTTNNNILTPDAIKHELDKQQVAIDHFFEETNSALEQAENKLASLRSQVATGALELSNIQITNAKVNTETEKEEATQIDTQPPRDYALKTDTQSPGTLSEEFGLNKDQEKATNN